MDSPSEAIGSIIPIRISIELAIALTYKFIGDRHVILDQIKRQVFVVSFDRIQDLLVTAYDGVSEIGACDVPAEHDHVDL